MRSGLVKDFRIGCTWQREKPSSSQPSQDKKKREERTKGEENLGNSMGVVSILDVFFSFCFFLFSFHTLFELWAIFCSIWAQTVVVGHKSVHYLFPIKIKKKKRRSIVSSQSHLCALGFNYLFCLAA
ncbi:unnamed protein product [Ilex paraguariensis]|uniref:Transmembrane protein n=1 Tax=Ilex paraguariensis TaxID=185542 RepID=A0ABC8UBH3_9AQUA